ncbi:MAG TPA: hypothetical protein VEC06_08875 [Paucimonas sp.]|nr:hypothetical protein [Paucimonas sp.]
MYLLERFQHLETRQLACMALGEIRMLKQLAILFGDVGSDVFRDIRTLIGLEHLFDAIRGERLRKDFLIQHLMHDYRPIKNALSQYWRMPAIAREANDEFPNSHLGPLYDKRTYGLFTGVQLTLSARPMEKWREPFGPRHHSRLTVLFFEAAYL